MTRRRANTATSKHVLSDEDGFDDDWDAVKSSKKKRLNFVVNVNTEDSVPVDLEDDVHFSMHGLLEVVSNDSETRGSPEVLTMTVPGKRIRLNLGKSKGQGKRVIATSGNMNGSQNNTGSTDNAANEDLGTNEAHDFEIFLEPELEGMKLARRRWREQYAESAMQGGRHRPLGTMELSFVAQSLRLEDMTQELSSYERLLMKRIELGRLRRQSSLPSPSLTFTPSPPSSPPETYPSRSSLIPLPPPRPSPIPPPSVISALSSIGTTPFSSSLLARTVGILREDDAADLGYLMRDWRGARATTWFELMEDVRGWYGIMYPEREQEEYCAAPVDYVSLQPVHLWQVHDLLDRIFWPGIDISDSLRFFPEQCTVVALYRHLVVGAAILSSPAETYMTYLVVRPGWENAGIATKMLHSLITRNPSKDIILHVSASNPAMLLYNRFGFKAEEFTVGFYEDYVDRNSRQSKNAFRLRLRR